MATAWPRRRRSSCPASTSPSALALIGDTLYVANTDALLAYPFTPGPTKLTATPRKLASFKPGGHWTRSLILPARTAAKLYIGVGSDTNIADNGHGGRRGPRLHLGI